MFIAATKMFFLIVMQTNVAMCNRSMSLGFPPSHLWTFLTLGVETRIEPWDFPPTARRYCDDNVSSLRSFYTLIFSLRTHKDIFWFTDSLSFTLSQVTKLSSPSDALFWAGCPVTCAVFWLFAQDPIVLDLTMQCIFCPWLCQAPWRLVSAVFLLLWTPKQSENCDFHFQVCNVLVYLCNKP